MMARPTKVEMPNLNDGRPCPNPIRWVCDLGHVHPSFAKATKCNRQGKKGNTADATGERTIGTHAGCGGDVVYWFSPTRATRRCLRCKMNSHAPSTDPTTGERRPPQSPTTTEEAKGDEK